MAAARRDGWQRRAVVVGQHEGDEREWRTDADGVQIYALTGRRKMFDDLARQDLCARCLYEMEEQP